MTRKQTQPRAVARRGLTFIELMFATIILGVGMIMIASVFPVAINEQRAMVDESTVTSIQRGAIRTLDAAVSVKAPKTQWLTDTTAGTISSFGATPALWDHIAGDLINKADPRYAWTALYYREPTVIGNPTNVTFFVVPMVSRNTAEFDGSTAVKLAKFMPSKVKITYVYKGDPGHGLSTPPDDDIIIVEADDTNSEQAAVEGAIVLRNQNVATTGTFPQNVIIKLGTRIDKDELALTGEYDTKRRFRVQPGFTLLKGEIPASDVNGTSAWIVGADYRNSGTANEALGCRAITVSVPNPG
ncbi:MAG: hypothetical protein QM754_06080 [Tepidisphaeraceae bacterium]